MSMKRLPKLWTTVVLGLSLSSGLEAKISKIPEMPTPTISIQENKPLDRSYLKHVEGRELFLVYQFNKNGDKKHLYFSDYTEEELTRDLSTAEELSKEMNVDDVFALINYAKVITLEGEINKTRDAFYVKPEGCEISEEYQKKYDSNLKEKQRLLEEVSKYAEKRGDFLRNRSEEIVIEREHTYNVIEVESPEDALQWYLFSISVLRAKFNQGLEDYQMSIDDLLKLETLEKKIKTYNNHEFKLDDNLLF